MAALKASGDHQPGDLLENFPDSFWYYHRQMGGIMQRHGFTLETLGRLGYGDYITARKKDPVITSCPDGRLRQGGSHTWTGTPELRWWHWIELMDDIRGVGPRRMLELVNFLRAAGAELPWFADFDQQSADWPSLRWYRREPAVITS